MTGYRLIVRRDGPAVRLVTRRGINAIVFTDQAGHMQAFLYIIAPQHVVHLSDAQAAAKSPDYLLEERSARLKKGR